MASTIRRPTIDELRGDSVRDPFVDGAVGPKAVFETIAPRSGRVLRLWAGPCAEALACCSDIVTFDLEAGQAFHLLGPKGWHIAAMMEVSDVRRGRRALGRFLFSVPFVELES